MRVLLTGASGLVGVAAVAALRARGHAVRALVHRRPAPEAAEALAGDVGEPEVWQRAFAGIDAAVHAAGVLTDDPTVLAHTNVRGTALAARAAHAAGCATFVLVSSAAVYAPGPMVDAAEDAAVGPADAYGISKLRAEAEARAVLGAALTVLRPVSVYATDRPTPIVDALRAIVTTARIPVVGDGHTPVDLVHAADLALAIAAAAEGRGRGETCNVAGPEPAPFLDLVRLAAGVLHVEPAVVPASPADRGAFSPWLFDAATVPRTVSIAHARARLGYAPVRDWRAEIPRALRAAP